MVIPSIDPVDCLHTTFVYPIEQAVHCITKLFKQAVSPLAAYFVRASVFRLQMGTKSSGLFIRRSVSTSGS
jgi:hypothetical protein